MCEERQLCASVVATPLLHGAGHPWRLVAPRPAECGCGRRLRARGNVSRPEPLVLQYLRRPEPAMTMLERGPQRSSPRCAERVIE